MKYFYVVAVLVWTLALPLSLYAQPWRMNSGGADFIDSNGDLFEADRAYVTGDFGYMGGSPRTYTNEILGTNDDALYQTIRFGTSPFFSYLFDNVPPDTYSLILYFMEPVSAVPGTRLIDVTVEGVLRIDDLDVYARTGALFTAYSETLTVVVSDGQLNVDLATTTGNSAIICGLAATVDSSVATTTFEMVTGLVGIAPTHTVTPGTCGPPLGSGSAWADYDNDGDLDLYITNQGVANYLYSNQGDMNQDGLPDFMDVAASAGVDDPSGIGHSAVFIDYDNDGDQDLYITNWGGNKMFQNQLSQGGGAVYVDVTATAGLADGGRAITSAWGDFNQDGYLDVVLAKHFECVPPDPSNNEAHLYMSNGDGTFTNVTSYLCAGQPSCAQVMGLGFSPGWFDYDLDGDVDLYLVNDKLDGTWYHNVLWRNDGPDGMGGWLFTDVSTSSGTDKAVNGMGLGIGDYDNDGWFDLAFSNMGPNNLLHNNGDGTYSDVSASAGILRDSVGGNISITWGTCFFDHDNDGYLDLLYVGGYIGGTVIPEPDAFFRNNGDGTFTDYSDTTGLNHPARGRSASMADFDGDGFVDVFIGNFAEELLLYHNLSANQGNVNNWLTLTLQGTVSNRDAIGARVTATLNDGTVLTRQITSGPTHGGGDHRAAYLGLAGNTSAHVVVQWPTGIEEDFGDIAAGQKIHLVENSTVPRLYSNVTAAVGIDPTHLLDATCGMPPIGSGSAWADYDNDGDVDLFVTNHGGANHLWRNEGDTNGDGLPDFVDAAEVAGIDQPNEVSAGCVFADYDNDGDQDLYVLNWGGNTLYKNVLVEIGVPGFVDVTAVAGIRDNGRAITAAWGDYDQDGYLDLYITKHFECMPDPENSDDHLFKNNGDGTFTDVSAILCPGGAYPCDAVGGHGFSPGFFDYDNDGDLDIYVVNDIVGAGWGNVLFRNDGPDSTGAWAFSDVSAESGTDYSVNGMGLGIGDYNNDGWMDIAFSHVVGGNLLRNEGDGTFAEVTDSAGVRAATTPQGGNRVTWGTVFFDQDNDGWLDLFYVAGRIGDENIPQPNAFFRNNHDGTFSDWSDASGLDDQGRGRSASIADFDQDGYVDLFVGNFGQPAILYHNDSQSRGNTNHWLTVTLQGTSSNRDGIGSRLTLTTDDGVVQIRDITSGPTHGGGDQKVAHFGLGGNTSGTLSIRWPNGTVEDLGTVAADQFLHVIEGGVTGIENGSGVVEQYRLFQNYPNPFNPSTTIRYSIKEDTRVTLKVFDLLGQEVATLVDDFQPAGNKEVVWDGKNQAGSTVSTGMYIYRLKAGNFIQSQKMLLSK